LEARAFLTLWLLQSPDLGFFVHGEHGLFSIFSRRKPWYPCSSVYEKRVLSSDFATAIFLARIRKEFADASHNVPAYIIGGGNISPMAANPPGQRASLHWQFCAGVDLETSWWCPVILAESVAGEASGAVPYCIELTRKASSCSCLGLIGLSRTISASLRRISAWRPSAVVRMTRVFLKRSSE
jgi:hypothetical protein